MNWVTMSLRRKAQFLIDQIDGLSSEDVEEIYEEWGNMEFDRSAMGYDRSLATLWDLAYKRSLRNFGRLEDYEQQFVQSSEEK